MYNLHTRTSIKCPLRAGGERTLPAAHSGRALVRETAAAGGGRARRLGARAHPPLLRAILVRSPTPHPQRCISCTLHIATLSIGYVNVNVKVTTLQHVSCSST